MGVAEMGGGREGRCLDVLSWQAADVDCIKEMQNDNH